MAGTRPYFVVFNGVDHMIEASTAAVAVQHIVGAAVTLLRPARAAEVTAWMRAKKDIPVAGEKAVVSAAPSSAEVEPDALASHSDALALFEDWAGYDRTAGDNTRDAADTVGTFARMHPGGQLDLMTFDVLRERAPEFGFALIAAEMGVPRTDDPTYVAAIEKVSAAGLARVRARLEEQPMPFGDVVTAIRRHAGRDADQEAAS